MMVSALDFLSLRKSNWGKSRGSVLWTKGHEVYSLEGRYEQETDLGGDPSELAIEAMTLKWDF